MNAEERPENDSNLLPLAELEVLHKQEVKAKTALQVARMFKVCPPHRENSSKAGRIIGSRHLRNFYAINS